MIDKVSDMKKKRIIRRMGSLLLAGTMMLSVAAPAAAQTLSEAKDKKAKLEQSLAQAESLIDELSQSQNAAEDKVAALNAQLSDISGQIASLQSQLSEKNEQIIASQDAVAAAQESVDRQYADMKKRIQFMYENGQTSVLEMMLTSGSLADFVNKAEYFSRVSEYDRDKMTEYENSLFELSNAEEALKTQYAELEEMKAEVEKDQTAVSAMLSDKEEELAAISGCLTEAEQTAANYEAEVQAQNEVLAAIQAAEAERKAREAKEEADRQAALKKQQEEAAANVANSGNSQNNSNGGGNNSNTGSDSSSGNNSNTGSDSSSGNNGNTGNNGNSSTVTGKFTWPVPASRVISSDYGYREVPTAGAGANHNGIDIAAGYGSDVVAAADGKVITSRLSTTAGNMIIIDHGGGIYTVYMHNSSRLVAVGDQVSAGQTIAKVGSTGISTGNHLHFGVSVNGTYVNPWNYLK